MLTPKQEAFCIAYIETGNASEAYRRSYSAENMKPETVSVKACELLAHGKVSVRVAELRKELSERNKITLDVLLAELEEARQLAIKTEKAAPMVAASMGKAKLLGLEKQVIDHTSSDGTMSPKGRTLDDFYEAPVVPAKSRAS